MKQGTQLLLICFPEVIKGIAVHHAFLIFYLYYVTYKYNLIR